MVSPALAWLLPHHDAADAVAAPGAPGRPGPLPVRELSVLVAEGLLVEVAGTHVAADAAGCRAARAALLAGRLAPDEVVAGAAALWLHGAVDHCPVVDLLLTGRRRGGSHRDPAWRRTRAAVVPAEHVVSVCGVPATTVERAAADVALWHAPEEAAPLLRAAAAAGADPRRALGVLAGPPRPGLRRGRRQLREQLGGSSLRPGGSR